MPRDVLIGFGDAEGVVQMQEASKANRDQRQSGQTLLIPLH